VKILSAKGSLKLSRDPKFQALFAIRGVSANVFKLDLNGILANKEFNDLIKVLGCNVGSKFDLNKLHYNKIVIASDADIDGMFIRSLLCSFFFKVFPEIIQDGRLYIAEPPLYRVDDKKNPFVVNKEDYIGRYVKDVIREYKIGYHQTLNGNPNIVYLSKSDLTEFLEETSYYVEDVQLLSQHYKINDRLMEIILILLGSVKHKRKFDGLQTTPEDIMEWVNKNQEVMSNEFITKIQETFPEMYYDEKDRILKGVIDGKYQSIEISGRLIRKGFPIMDIISEYPYFTIHVYLRSIKTGTEYNLSLLETLKILKKFQPTIEKRFKGLAENSPDDMEFTVMNPNTRTLIRVHISDIENDMAVFQMLRGDTKEDLIGRKQLLANFKFTREMLDT
jgi:DNA gyrase subunit B